MIRRLILVALLGALAGCTAEGIGGLTLVTSGAHTLEPRTRVPGSVAVGAGELRLEEGATIDGDVFVGDGRVIVGGHVAGDLSAIGGTVVLGPTAHIEGGLRVGAAATVQRDAASRIDGGVHEGFTLPEGDAGPPSPWTDLTWSVVRALLLVLVAVAVRQVAPRRTANVAAYLTDTTAASTAYGFLIALVGVSLLVFMAFTIVLIPVAIIGLLSLAFGVVLGLAGGLDAIARRVGGRRAALVAVVTTLVVPAIPVAGMLILLWALLASLGAAALSFQRPTPSMARGRGTAQRA